MKQFFCVLVALAASAALLFLVSTPVGESHGAAPESSETSSVAHGPAEETASAAQAH